jgi:hypothetical protein
MKYYTIIAEADSDEDLDRILLLARDMPSYHRIYIDDLPDLNWDENQYRVEIVLKNEHEATMLQLKL